MSHMPAQILNADAKHTAPSPLPALVLAPLVPSKSAVPCESKARTSSYAVNAYDNRTLNAKAHGMSLHVRI